MNENIQEVDETVNTNTVEQEPIVETVVDTNATARPGESGGRVEIIETETAPEQQPVTETKITSETKPGVILIERNKFPIHVLPIKIKDLDLTKCSKSFREHVVSQGFGPEFVVHVKCDPQGNPDFRRKSGDQVEYRVYHISKIEAGNAKQRANENAQQRAPKQRPNKTRSTGVERGPTKIDSRPRNNAYVAGPSKIKQLALLAVKWLLPVGAIAAIAFGTYLVAKVNVQISVGVLIIFFGYNLLTRLQKLLQR